MKELRTLQVPHDCYVVLTSRCNLRCLHCYGSYGETGMLEDELTGSEWGSVFSELASLGVFFVNISGGEPTLHPDFPEIMHHIRRTRLHYILTTNGLCSHEAREAIRESADLLIGMKVSLDGPDPESHTLLRVGPDMIGRPQYFERTLDTIHYFKAQSVPFTIATCLHKKNINKMLRFLDLVLELQPVSWFISSIAPSGRAQQFPDIYAPDSVHGAEFWEYIKSVCEDHQIFVHFIDMPTAARHSENASVYECPAARWFCEVSSDGTVAPCPLARVSIPESLLKFDNIRTKSLREIWKGSAFETFRKWQTQGCSGCKCADKCARCIPQSIQWFGDPLKPPPYCIQKGDLLRLDDLESLQEDLKSRIETLGRSGYVNLPIETE